MTKPQKHIAFIMAGGIGERFWPVTSEALPKYAMSLEPGLTFLNATYNRLKSFVSEKNIGVITSAKHRSLVLKLLPKLNQNLLLCEPERKNTAAAVTWGTLAAEKIIGQNSVVSFYPADALIKETVLFKRSALKAASLASSNIVVLGIKPSRPSTAYGYIQIQKTSAQSSPVRMFKEKPNAPTAARYVKSGNYLWNAGIFFWTPEQFKKEMLRYNPAYIEQFFKYFKTDRTGPAVLKKIFSKIPSEPIDKLLIEKLEKLICVKTNFQWDDIGSWEALHRMKASKPTDNILLAESRASVSTGNIVYSDNVRFAIQGVHNLIIAEKNGIVMICPREDAEKVKVIRQEWVRKKND